MILMVENLSRRPLTHVNDVMLHVPTCVLSNDTPNYIYPTAQLSNPKTGT